MQTQIVHLEDAYGLLDDAVAAAIRNSKPVYISICCNMAGEVHPSFAGKSSCAFSKVLLHVEGHTVFVACQAPDWSPSALCCLCADAE